LKYRPPRWVIFCPVVSASSWDLSGWRQDLPDETNVAARLAAWRQEQDAALTVLASDTIFAGPRMFHEETSAATATGPWAEAARKLEQVLAGSETLIVRSHPYGWSPKEDSFCEQLWNAAIDRKPVALDGRRHATPLLASDLAEFLLRARQNELRGTLHVAGAERASPFRFASEMASALGLAGPQAVATTVEDALGELAETSLSCRLARKELGLSAPLLREGLARFAAQVENGWRDRLRGESWTPAASSRFAA
jgi:dTDP-4-dehydrorhamnose reductase